LHKRIEETLKNISPANNNRSKCSPKHQYWRKVTSTAGGKTRFYLSAEKRQKHETLGDDSFGVLKIEFI
jgi:hypothetical protein